jgi:hypothetical protein
LKLGESLPLLVSQALYISERKVSAFFKINWIIGIYNSFNERIKFLSLKCEDESIGNSAGK